MNKEKAIKKNWNRPKPKALFSASDSNSNQHYYSKRTSRKGATANLLIAATTTATTFAIIFFALLFLNAETSQLTAAATTAAVTPTPTPAPTPSISITAPANNATFAAPASFTLTTAADGAAIGIDYVEFFNCRASLGSDTSDPTYTRSVSNLGAGTYTFTAVLVDGGGKEYLSDPITITVTGTLAPEVQLVNPTSNRVFEAGDTINMSATATANGNGSIARVEFYNGSTKLGEDTSVPYSFAWSGTNGTGVAESAEYRLTAKVVTSNNATDTSQPAFVTVTPPASSIKIKETNYPIPTDGTARYVDNTSGNDANNGLTLQTAWKTIRHAVNTAPDGSTIVVRGGTYREGGSTTSSSIEFKKKLTLQPLPGEDVWIKGSEVVTGWQYDAAQALWYKDFPYEFDRPTGSRDIDTDYARNPLASLGDMVFINNRPLAQTARFEACDLNYTPVDCTGGVVQAGTFCLDYGADTASAADNRLYIKDDPTGKTVEATARKIGLTLKRDSAASNDGSDSTVRGIGFAHFAERAVVANALRIKIEDNTFVWNEQGMRFGGTGGQSVFNTTLNANPERQYAVIRGNNFSYNGIQGAGGAKAHNMLVENNVFSWNNVERFRSSWSAAGIKITVSDDAVFRNNLFERNLATALWLDVSITDATVVNNVVRRNSGIGLFFEVSSRAIIASNLVTNSGTGIMVSGSSKVRIFNNTLVNNSKSITVKDYNRINNKEENGNNPSAISAEIAAGIDWETRDVTVRNNIFSNATTTATPNAMVDVNDGPCSGTPAPCNDAETNFAHFDYNAYYRTDVGQPDFLVRWKPKANSGSTDKTYAALATVGTTSGFRTTGNETNGREFSGSANPFFVNEARGDYRLRPNSVVRGSSQALPATVEWTNADGQAVSVASVMGVSNAAGAVDPGAGSTLLAANAPNSAAADFDGDGRTDISVFRPANGTWHLLASANNFAYSNVTFGVTGDKLAPADFDGDGTTDIALYRPSNGTWYVQQSTAGFRAVQWGVAEDKPVPADYDGDGKADYAVFRPSTGAWFIYQSSNNTVQIEQFGVSEDVPTVGDYDGDGRADKAVWRPGTGTWYQMRSAQGFAAQQFGISSDKPVAGDYDADGRTDIAVWRPGTGQWYVVKSGDAAVSVGQFGISTDVPTPGDYDGDGRSDFAVYRASSGVWYMQQSRDGFAARQFGVASDKAVPSAFIR